MENFERRRQKSRMNKKNGLRFWIILSDEMRELLIEQKMLFVL